MSDDDDFPPFTDADIMTPEEIAWRDERDRLLRIAPHLEAENEALRQQLQAERERVLVLEDACKAALKYDEAIERRGWDMEVSVGESGIAYSTGDDLDALYLDWMTKAKKAMEASDG